MQFLAQFSPSKRQMRDAGTSLPSSSPPPLNVKIDNESIINYLIAHFLSEYALIGGAAMATGHQGGEQDGLQRLVREIIKRQPTQLLEHRRHVTRLQNHLQHSISNFHETTSRFFHLLLPSLPPPAFLPPPFLPFHRN